RGLLRPTNCIKSSIRLSMQRPNHADLCPFPSPSPRRAVYRVGDIACDYPGTTASAPLVECRPASRWLPPDAPARWRCFLELRRVAAQGGGAVGGVGFRPRAASAARTDAPADRTKGPARGTDVRGAGAVSGRRGLADR